MRSRIQGVVLPSEVGDFADEIRRVFLELGRTFGPGTLAGECSPALDVYEADEAVHVTVDLPGVAPTAVRVLIKGQNLLIVGEKPARAARTESSFHLVERGFGRFVRTVRIGHAVDARSARATLVAGELRVIIPKITERRGQPIQVALSSPSA
jgi:HSP20 family protein